MASTQHLKEQNAFDEKDGKWSPSVPEDEESASPLGEKQDDKTAAATDEEQPAVPQDRAKDEDVIPNGGLRAWLQVLGSFMLFFNTFGILKYVPIADTYVVSTNHTIK